MNRATKLTDTEEYLWSYITKNTAAIANYSISELSEAVNVSNATITRTLQKKGYSGFSDFKHSIATQKKDQLNILDSKKMAMDTKHSIVKNYQEVVRTLNMLDVDALEEAIPQLTEAKRIIIFARGFSEMLGNEMLVKFQLLHKYCEMHTDPNIIVPVSKQLSPDDFVLFISLNGETAALVTAAKNCQNNNIPNLLITANKSGSLAKLTRLKLYGFKTELSYFPDFEVHSRLPLYILGRVLLDTFSASLQSS